MRTNHLWLLWLSSLVGLSTLALPGVANATVVWTSGFETGDLSEWSPGINATKMVDGGIRKNVVVEQAVVYAGKYACEVTVHPDDLFGQYNQDRVDIQHQSTLTGEGQDTWISGHYMMPADAGVRNEFAFWESNVSSTNVIDFWVEPKTGGGTTINFGVGFLGATQLWSADFTIGTWHQVAIHVHWSTNPQLGSVDVWFDGQQVVTAYKTQTKPDANTLFYQNGLHRKDPEPFVDTIYIDAFVEADTYAEAQIATPTAPEPDGGTGSDGGADEGASSSGGAGDAGGAVSSRGAGDAGMGAATSGEGETTGSAASTGNPEVSGAGSSGTGAAAGAAGDTGGATSGAGAASTSPDGGAKESSRGCAISSNRAPATFLASLVLVGTALARRRRRG